MAEAAGLAVGVVALAGLFNSTVGCFVYVRIAGTFDRDLQTSELRLEQQHLRLSRWGTALGLDLAPNTHPTQLPDDHPIRQSSVTQRDIDKLERWLKHLSRLFADAEAAADQFADHSQDAARSTDTTPNTQLAKLTTKFKQMSLARSKNQKSGKISWALYKRDEFERLIDDITDVVDMLVDHSREFEDAQLQLAEAEVAEIGDDVNIDNGLRLLDELVTPESDAMMAKALQKALSAAPQNTYNTNFHGTINGGMQSGHITGGTFYVGR